MNINTFLEKLNNTPQNIAFTETMSVIDENYNFTPSEFSNGSLTNEANQNSGSCKIFAFAKLQNISEELTLHCFGDYYRKDVLENINGEDHQNIRNFMTEGWSGIKFSQQPLISK